MVKRYTGTLGSAQLAVAEVPEPLTFLGYGLDGGDQVRWILDGEEDYTITLDSTSAGIFNFTITQNDFNPVLCYKFGVENFKLLLIPNPLNTDNDYLSYLANANTFEVAISSLISGKRVYLCYGFGQEPFKLFKDLYLDVKSITNMRALIASPNVAVAGTIKAFLFDGNGVETGDFAKFVSSNSSDCTNPGVTLMNILKEYDDFNEMAMYLYEVSNTTTTGMFQVNDDRKSAGLDRVLCYRFGVEPFAFYKNFRIDVKTIWGLHQADTTAGGKDNVVVVNEPKRMIIDGVVKEITALLDYTFPDIVGLGGVATIGHQKQWKPVGSGIQDGDSVKIVPQSVTSSADCGKEDTNIAAGTTVMTVGPK
ncbi:Hypothetical protein PHPALM_10654 [Phytophthora palmivora]|uniref:Uncharacterized protein n=1 Tax=Phytophthora palmivora TaxID=4796 RepID=A0A2P4Y4H2_9STRA|nr:Hypothetical protein PHPALM_10654 [Phytophthora palmivora]